MRADLAYIQRKAKLLFASHNRPRDLPFLFLLTDAARKQTPQKLLQTAPQGSAIIIRTFGDDVGTTKANKNRSVKICATISPRKACRIGLAGVHIPNKYLKYYRKSQAKPRIITASAHNLREILQAKRLGITNILLSPIFPTASKSANKRPIGTIRLAKITRDFRALQFIALGGINRKTLKRLSGTNVKAVAGVSFRGSGQNLKADSTFTLGARPRLSAPLVAPSCGSTTWPPSRTFGVRS